MCGDSEHLGQTTCSVCELAELLERVSAGDQDAFGRFYDATCHRVFGMVLSVLGDRRHAEAVAQDVYVTAWKSAPTFALSRRTPIAWLAAIVGTQIMLLAHTGSRGLGGVICDPV